jgi:hypothetical protein
MKGRKRLTVNFSVDCTIRDLSETGARIRTGANSLIEDRVWLIHLRAGVAYQAIVAWRGSLELGLRFSEQIDLKHPIAGHYHHLRRLWLDCGGGYRILHAGSEVTPKPTPLKVRFGSKADFGGLPESGHWRAASGFSRNWPGRTGRQGFQMRNRGGRPVLVGQRHAQLGRA